MFSPSDYNDAVPQFTNGNYANTPLNPLYVDEPDAVNYSRGAEPLQTLPAQWWNWLCNKITAKLNKLNIYVKNIFDELAQLLSLVSVTPDATEEEITTGQLKDMFEAKYPILLGNNFKFESVLQGRTRGVMLPPSDTWNAGTHTLSLSGGFGILDTYKKVNFADSTLVLPNDNNTHYIVSASDGTLSIENSLGNNVILVGLCNDDEYCLLTDVDPNQCKDNIILKKWFGDAKITQGFVPILQSYYNTSITSIETNIFITNENISYGINGGTFNNCTISFGTAGGYGGISGGTFDNCTISFGTVNNTYLGGIGGGTFNNCTISIDTVGGYGISGGTFNNCTISIDTVSNNSANGIYSGTFENCIIKIRMISSGTGIRNNASVYLYLTHIICSSMTPTLSNTGGKLSVVNNVVLHAS